jgi:ribosomal protein L34E
MIPWSEIDKLKYHQHEPKWLQRKFVRQPSNQTINQTEKHVQTTKEKRCNNCERRAVIDTLENSVQGTKKLNR